jgi:GNAT superfamily N-acetyltransferase
MNILLDDKGEIMGEESIINHKLFNKEFGLNVFNTNRVLVLSHLEVYDKNKGYGTKLVNKFFEYAKRNNYKQIFLNASPLGYDGLTIKHLVKFYEKFGFKVIRDAGHNKQMVANV